MKPSLICAVIICGSNKNYKPPYAALLPIKDTVAIRDTSLL